METAGQTTAKQLLKKLNSFPWEEWNKSLAEGMKQPYRDLVISQAKKKAKELGSDLDAKDPLLSRFMTKYVGERVSQLNGTTKKEVANVIRNALASGETDDLTEKILDTVREKFEGYESWRATRIARTETGIAFNHANVLGFHQGGVEEVEVVDGTADDICEEANGETWTLVEALSDPLGHPNCERAFIPIASEEERGSGPLELLLAADDKLPLICAIRAEYLTGLEDPCGRPMDDFDDED